MKNLFSIAIFVQLLLLVACKKTDQALLTQMNDTVAEMQTQTEQFDMNTQGILSFATLVDTAPEGLKADTLSGYAALQAKVTSVKIKQQGTVSEFREILAELQKSAEAYAAGKIPTDEARSQQETLSGRLIAIKELLAHVSKINDEAQTEYGKMMAEYRSKTE